MRLERRAEGLKNGAKEGTGTIKRDPSGGEHQLRLPLRPCRRQKRCSRGEPKAMDLRHRFANLPKESDVREPDGRSCNGRELRAGFGCGKTQQRGGGDRPDDDEGTGEASSGALGKDSGEAVGGNLCSKPCEEGRNTQTERWHKDAGNPDGTGSVHSADGVAGADADLDPQFSESSYGFRPGRSAQDAVRAAQRYAQGGKEWVVDIDITKFFDHRSEE